MRTITVKLCNPILNVTFALITFLSLLLLFSLILSRYLTSAVYPPISFLLAAISSGFLARYLSQGSGDIELSDHSVRITSYNEYLNQSYSYTAHKNELNAFEIYKDKFFTRLVLYKYGKAPKSFTLITDQSQETELIAFLRNDVRHLDKKTQLSGLTFFSSFSRAFGILIMLAAGIVTVYLTANWFYYSANKTVISINVIYWLFLTLIFLVIYNKAHYRNNFRITGRYVTWLFFSFLSLLLYITLLPASYSIFQDPKHVESLPGSISDHTQKFLIPRQIIVDTTQIGYYYKVQNNGAKSRVHTVTHYFTAPASDLNDRGAINHHVFLGHIYLQKISKSLRSEDKNRLRINFLNSKANDFKTDVTKHSAFFEVLHHQNNRAFKNPGLLYSALSTQHTKSPLMIVKAHKESFREYQSSKKKNILIVSLIAVALLAVNALIIALNR